jgi:regulator of replication initiation timing
MEPGMNETLKAAGHIGAELGAALAENARLMNTLAELARRAPLRTLHTICETQHQVSTVKLERYLEPIGDTLAGYAFTLRIDFDKLSAALSAVTAERDRLLSDNASLRGSCKALGEENKQLKRENKRQGRTIAAMDAKEE